MEVTAKFAMANHRIYHGANLRITLGRLKMTVHRIIFYLFPTSDIGDTCDTPRSSISSDSKYHLILPIRHLHTPKYRARHRISAFEKRELRYGHEITNGTTNCRILYLYPP